MDQSKQRSDGDETVQGSGALVLVSADSHFLEPPDMWVRHLPSKFRDAAPKLIEDGYGGHAWMYDGYAQAEPIAVSALPGPAARRRWVGVPYEDARPGTYSGRGRCQDQDIDGVSAEVIFPTPRTIGHFLGQRDAALVLAGVEAHNRFVRDEFCAADTERLFPVAQLPNTGVDDAIRTLHSIADRGFVGAAIASWPAGGEQLGPADDKFWAAAAEVGLPICIHGALRSRKQRTLLHELALTRPRVPIPAYQEGPIPNPGPGLGRAAATLGELLLSTVFEDHPLLRVGMIESWIGWIPYLLDAVDDLWERNRYRHASASNLCPSTYWHNNMMASFVEDRSGIELIDRVGAGNVMWSTDYPHFVTQWPNSREGAVRALKTLPPRDARRIAAGNAVDFFGIDLQASP